jgi:hypothetical protein
MGLDGSHREDWPGNADCGTDAGFQGVGSEPSPVRQAP